MSLSMYWGTIVLSVVDLVVLWLLWRKRQECIREWLYLSALPLLMLWILISDNTRKDLPGLIALFCIFNALCLLAYVVGNFVCDKFGENDNCP